MKTLSIYIRMIAYFLAISLLPMLGMSFLAYYQVSDLIRKDNQRMLRAIAVDTAFQIEHELVQRTIEVKAWARLPVLSEALLQDRSTEAADFFDRLVTTYPNYDLLVLINGKRQVLATNTVSRTGQPLAVQNLPERPLNDGQWFDEARRKSFYLTGYRQSPLVQELFKTRGDSLNISLIVTDDQNRPIGYLVAYLNWIYLQEILNVVQITHADEYNSMMYLVEIDSHKIIGHRNLELYGQPYLFEVDLREKVQIEAAGVFEYDWPVRKTIGYAQVRGGDQMPAMPWMICIEGHNDIIYANANFLRDLFLLFTLIAALLIVIVVYFISKRFSDPILSLVKGAQSIAGGDMKVEMPVLAGDEIGILANAFNQMLDALRQRDRELKESNLELEQANRLKSEFLANMSHELRTPMNSIIGFTTLVLQRVGSTLPEQQRSNLVKVRKNAFQLLTLLNSILDLSKIESGSMEVAVEEFSMRGLVDACLATITPLVEGRQIGLIRDFPEADFVLRQDRQKLQQILINLLGNAVKFTQRGHIRVGFATADRPGTAGEPAPEARPWLRLWVEDTGLGIQEKDLPHIFSEFRQGDGSSTRRFGGTGLGLAISKKLANLLGGDIEVGSVAGAGSTFTVIIPVWHEKTNEQTNSHH